MCPYSSWWSGGFQVELPLESHASRNLLKKLGSLPLLSTMPLASFSIFWLLATLSFQAVPRRPAILVPCRLQCQLYSSQSSTAEISTSCQNPIRQFPARQPLLCGYRPCMHLWSVDQQEDLCFVLGLRGWQFFLILDAVVKRHTLDPGPALL